MDEKLVAENDMVTGNGQCDGSRMVLMETKSLSGHLAPPIILPRAGGNR